MKKQKLFLVIALYLLILNGTALPVLFKDAVHYNPRGDSVNFLQSLIFLFLKSIVIANIISAFGLLFIKEWARVALIVIIGVKILMALYMNIFAFAEHTSIVGDFVYLLIFIYLVSPHARRSIIKYSIE